MVMQKYQIISVLSAINSLDIFSSNWWCKRCDIVLVKEIFNNYQIGMVNYYSRPASDWLQWIHTMYPWYKDNHPISVKYYNAPAPPPPPALSNIKKETGGGGFRDCMVSLDYACHNKVKIVPQSDSSIQQQVPFLDHSIRPTWATGSWKAAKTTISWSKKLFKEEKINWKLISVLQRVLEVSNWSSPFTIAGLFPARRHTWA